ncbi:MAG: hypothetical protein M3541_10825, partial [Acidobacteriota bacterium]|nr:hypothetical protein [Acidobacteriota bacterium]
GTAYNYFRHPDLNTNNWLNERNGEPKTTSSCISTALASAARSSSPVCTTAAAKRSTCSTTSS